MAESVTYKCNVSIDDSTLGVADYVPGMSVGIKLETDDGRTLWAVTATTFPQMVNYYNLSVSGGTITLTYTVEITGTFTTETRTITRRVEFVKE